MRFEEKIVQLRKEAGFSQEQLAEKLGVSRQAISRWESGDSTPDITNLLGICNCFGVSSDYLIHDDYKPDEVVLSEQKAYDEKQMGKVRKKVYFFGVMVGQLLAIFLVTLQLIFGSQDLWSLIALLIGFVFMAVITFFMWLWG